MPKATKGELAIPQPLERKDVSEMEKIKRFLKEEEGVTMLEYALIAALVGVAAILALTTLGSKLSSTFDNVATQAGS